MPSRKKIWPKSLLCVSLELSCFSFPVAFLLNQISLTLHVKLPVKFLSSANTSHDNVIKRKHFPRYWPFVRGIHRSPVNSLHKGQWRGALMFSLICARISDWVNNGEAGDLRRNHAHYDVIVMHITILHASTHDIKKTNWGPSTSDLDTIVTTGNS